MAASMSVVWSRRVPMNNRFIRSCFSFTTTTRRLLSSEQPEESVAQDVSVSEQWDQEEIDKIRNVSRLPGTKRGKLDHVGTMPNLKFEYMRSVPYQRRLYAKFGSKSGIDPKIAWPTLEELRETIAEEKEWEPTLQEMWRNVEEAKRSERESVEKRAALVEKNMTQMAKWISEHHDRLAAKEEEARKQREKRQKLLDEAREYFGYDVDPRDVKFQEMIEQKELQRKKELKAKRKLDAAAKLAEKLRQMAQEADTTPSPPSKESEVEGDNLNSSELNASPASENSNKSDS